MCFAVTILSHIVALNIIYIMIMSFKPTLALRREDPYDKFSDDVVLNWTQTIHLNQITCKADVKVLM